MWEGAHIGGEFRQTTTGSVMGGALSIAGPLVYVCLWSFEKVKLFFFLLVYACVCMHVSMGWDDNKHVHTNRPTHTHTPLSCRVDRSFNFLARWVLPSTYLVCSSFISPVAGGGVRGGIPRDPHGFVRDPQVGPGAEIF